MSNWRETTEQNSRWIQEIFAMEPKLSVAEKLTLYREAQSLTSAMLGIGNNRYWGVFINTLRTLVAGLAKGEPKLFKKKPQRQADDHWMTSGRGSRQMAGT